MVLPPLCTTPLCIFNQEENTAVSEEIGVEEREEEERSDETSEEEGEVNNTLPQTIVVWKDPTNSSQKGGTSSSSKMENQDSTLRFLVFHGMGKDDAEKHWFTCEAIWSVKRVTDDATKITQLETTFKDRALMWYMKYKATVPVGQVRSLAEIKQDLLQGVSKVKVRVPMHYKNQGNQVERRRNHLGL
jgi:hypothetical protein